MDKYKNKYLKYKIKYLNLKKMIGGNQKEITIDITKLHDLFITMVDDFNLEFSFNILVDNSSNTFLMIQKGISDMSLENIIDGYKFSYFQGHTHFHKGTENHLFTPPSSKDYIFTLESFYRFYCQKQFIASYNGFWIISINDKLNFFNTENDDLKKQLKLFDYFRDNLYEYGITDEWESILNFINKETNNLHIALAQPPELEKKLPQISLEEYIIKIKDIGFDISFTFWEDATDLKFRILLDENKYNYINNFNFNKKNKLININEININNFLNLLYITNENTEILFN